MFLDLGLESFQFRCYESSFNHSTIDCWQVENETNLNIESDVSETIVANVMDEEATNTSFGFRLFLTTNDDKTDYYIDFRADMNDSASSSYKRWFLVYCASLLAMSCSEGRRHEITWMPTKMAYAFHSNYKEFASSIIITSEWFVMQPICAFNLP